MFLWYQLALMLIMILLAALLFSNALEYLGEKIGLSSGVTGSILAAISTALPETTIPLLALIHGTSNQTVNEEISVGAILGAPLMLSTLSLFIMAASITKQRGFLGKISPEYHGLKRDCDFFLIAFIIAAIAMIVPHNQLLYRGLFSLLLIGLYIIYVVLTFKASKDLVQQGHGIKPTEPLLFAKIGFKKNLTTIIIQLSIGLIFLLLGAKGFINTVHTAANDLGISTLLLSLLIVPIATELPEKINSVLWARKNKDTLAVGNITGAMVFQGTLLPAIGIFLTPWEPSKAVFTGIIITLIAGIWLRINSTQKGIKISVFFVNGLLYLLYISMVF